MVAVVSGNGLGLLNGSLAQLGLASGGAAGLGQSRDRQYINTANGNLVIQGADSALVFNGVSLSDLRTYNSEAGGGGQGWLWGFSRNVAGLTGTVNTAGSTIKRVAEDGSELTYTYDSSLGGYRAAGEAGARDTLTWNTSTARWTWTDADSRRQEVYNSDGLLLSVSDPLTGGSYTLAYTNQRLTSVTAADGDVLSFGYDNQGRVVSLSTSEVPPGGGSAVTRTAVTYGYDSLGRLTTVSTSLDADGQASSAVFSSVYEYDGTSNRIARLTQSDGVTVAYAYTQGTDGVWRVTTITTGSGSDASVQTIGYATVVEQGLTLTATTITDASGRGWTYKADAGGRLVAVVSPAVDGQRQTTTYNYDANGNVTSVVDALGNTTTYGYDTAGNRITEQDALGDSITRTYSATNQLLTETTYRTATPGAAPTSSSTPETVRYVYQNDRLRFIIDAKGGVTENQYDAAGKLVMTRQFNGAKYAVSGLAPATGITLAQMNTWVSARDLRQTLRTDLTYDLRGLLATRRQYGSVDATGAGVVDSGTSTTRYLFDAMGQLRQSAVVRGNTTDAISYAYDGLGRLVGSVSATGVSSTWTYGTDGTTTQVTVDTSGASTAAAGSVRTEVRNSRGDLVAVRVSDPATSQTRVTQYVYDAADDLRAVVYPDGAVEYRFYDTMGRLSATVDTNGAATSYLRDADGRVLTTTEHATLVDTTAWFSSGAVVPTEASSVLPPADAADRVSHVSYDAAGRVATSTDASGTVTVNTYDGESNLVKVVVGSGTNARTTRYFYDPAGRLQATLDANGYLTETVYDEAGQVKQTIAYATITAASKRATGTLAQLRPAGDWNDHATTYFYDAEGRIIGTLDGESYFTRAVYDENTHTLTSTRYALKLDDRPDSTWATLVSMTDGTDGHTTVTSYDANGRATSITNPEGSVARYSYDAFGRLVQTTEAYGSDDARVQGATYDAFGQMTQSVDGEGNVTTYTYDAMGREVSRTDPEGHKTYSIYDAGGRLAFTVHTNDSSSGADAYGSVTQYGYDTFGDVVRTTQYATFMDMDELGDFDTMVGVVAALANPATDGNTQAVYDSRGNVVQSVDGRGALTTFTYDTFGQLASTTHWYGSNDSTTTTAYAYDKLGHLLTTTEDVGGIARVNSSTWDAFGRVVTEVDGTGSVVLHEYDDIDRETTRTITVDGDARQTITRFDAFGRTLLVTDPAGNETSYVYDDVARSVTVTTPEGVVTVTTWNREGETTSVTDATGAGTHVTYDHDGHVLSTTNAVGGAETNTYDAAGRLKTTVDAQGRKVAYTYDSDGRVLTRTVDPDHLSMVTVYAYDGRGQKILEQDASGVQTVRTFDADGNILVETTGSTSTAYTYDAEGHQLTVTRGTAGDITVTRFVYDALGRVIQRIQGDGGLNLTTSYTYDADNHVTSSTDPTGQTTYYAYDERGLLIFTVKPVGAPGANQGVLTRYTYDARGQQVSTRVLAAVVGTAGLAAAVAGGTQSARDTMSALVDASWTDADASTYQVLDADGRLRYLVAPDGSVTESRYDALGRLSDLIAYGKVIVPGGNLTDALRDGTATEDDIRSAMDEFGLSEATAQHEQYYYDGAGRLRFTVARDQIAGATAGVVTETRYNAAGDVVATVRHAVTLTAAQLGAQQTTDSLASLLASDTGANEIDSYYDAAGRLVASRDADGGITYTFYDAAGRVVGTVDPTGAIVTYTYGAAGLLTAKVGYDQTVDTSTWFQDGVVTIALADVLPQPNYDGQLMGRTTTYEYDTVGRLSRQLTNMDAWGSEYQSISYVYDGASRATSVSIADQSDGYTEVRTTQNVYDADGRLIASLSPMGYLTEHFYDAAGNEVRTIAYANGAPRDDDGNLTGTDLDGWRPAASADDRVTTSFRDSWGRLSGQVDPEGYFTSYGYDIDGRLLSTTRYATRVSDANGSETAIRAELSGSSSRASSATYDVYGRITTSTDAQGTVTAYTYDARGHVLATIVAAGTADASSTSSSYDAMGNLVRSVDALGHATTYQYDNAGRLVGVTDPMGAKTWYVNDKDGRVLYTLHGMADANGEPNAQAEVVRNEYTAFGEAASTTRYTARLVLASIGQLDVATLDDLVAQIASNETDSKTLYEYDDAGNVVSVTSGVRSASYTYDAFGELVSSNTDGGSELTGCGYGQSIKNYTVYTHDADGRLVDSYEGVLPTFALVESAQVHLAAQGVYVPYWEPSYGALRSLHREYDAFGNLTGTMDGRGVYTAYTYDRLGQRVSTTLVTYQGDETSTTAYDAFHRVVTQTDALGHTTTYAYDDVARTMVVTSPLGVTMTTAYDRHGQAISVRDAQGKGTTYVYDADGELLSTTDANGATTQSTYDAGGHVLRTVDGNGRTVAYSYDAAGRVLTKTVDPEGLSLVTRYAYDGVGNMLTEMDPTGSVTAYTYDANGNQLSIIRDYGDETHANLGTYFRYDSAGHVVAVIDFSPYNVPRFSYGYDALGRLVETDAKYDTIHRYAYDQSGNMSYETDANNYSTMHVFDEHNREIVTAQSVYGEGSSYSVTRRSYDAVGNLVATHRYDEMGSNNYIYQILEVDPWSGNWNDRIDTGMQNIMSGLSGLGQSPDQTTVYAYDADNHLRFQFDGEGSATEYRYDAFGHLRETLAYGRPVSQNPTGNAEWGAFTEADATALLSNSGISDADAERTFSFYDDDGRLRFTIKDGPDGGHVTETRYDASGNVTGSFTYKAAVPAAAYTGAATTQSLAGTLANAAAEGSRSFYDSAGRKVYEVDSAGYVKEWRYDGAGRQTWALTWAKAVTLAADADTTAVAQAVASTNTAPGDARGTGHAYNELGLVAADFASYGGAPTVTYEYNRFGLLSQSNFADGSIHTFDYDDRNRLDTETIHAVYSATYNNGLITGTQVQDIETSYSYDGNDRLISKSEWSGGSSRSTTYSYDYAGRVTHTEVYGDLSSMTGDPKSASGYDTYSYYDRLGNDVKDIDAAGNTTFHAYDRNGRLVYDVDGSGYVTGYTYDGHGRVVSVVRYATPVDTNSFVIEDYNSYYFDSSAVQSALVPSDEDRVLVTRYDDYGNKIEVVQPAVQYTKADGSTAVGHPVTRYTYDTSGRVTSESVLVEGDAGNANAVWSTTYTFYDAAGHKSATVDPLGYMTTWSYDASGNVLSMRESARAVSTTGLVAGGTPPTVPAEGDAATGFDRVTTYTYNAEGRVASETNLRSVAQADGSAARQAVSVTYGYDTQGRATTVTTNGRTVTTTYDAAGRITRVTGPQESVLVDNWQALLAADPTLTPDSASLYHLSSEFVDYTYDVFGNKVKETHGSTGGTVTANTFYRYDGQGNVIASVASNDGTEDWASASVHRMEYDGLGHLLSTSYSLTGNDHASYTVKISNAYDASGRLVATSTNRSNGGIEQSQGSSYDAFGDVIGSGTASATSATATFDNAGRMISEVDPATGVLHTYGYNLAGQRITDTWAAADGSGNVTMRYTRDLDGRATAQTTPTAAGYATLTAAYDRWGNVVASTDARGAQTTFTYDELNHVVSETGPAVLVVAADGTSQTVATTTVTRYDADGNVATVTDANGYGTRTTYDAMGRVIRVTDGTGASLRYAYDAMGNQVLDQDGNGNLTFRNYDKLGRVVQQGDFVPQGSGRAAVWRQAYVLDEAGHRLRVYDGTGAALLQAGNTTAADQHADWYGYDSQGRVLWSQDQAQRAASTGSNAPITGQWAVTPYNPSFSQDAPQGTGWDAPAGFSFTTTGAYWRGGTDKSGLMVNKDRVPVNPGQKITANLDAQVTIGPGGGAAVVILWYAADGSFISATSDAGIVTDGDGRDTSTSVGTAPPGAMYASIGVSATSRSSINTISLYSVSWDYVPPVWATSTNSDGQVVVNLPTGSFTVQPVNPDFENATGGWDTEPAWSLYTGNGYNGSHGSARLGNTGGAVSTITNVDRVPVTAGQLLNASVMVQQGSASAGDAGAAVKIIWFDAAGNEIGASTGNYVTSGSHGAWKLSSVRATAPANAAFAKLAIEGFNRTDSPLSVDGATWDYQYLIPSRPGVVQTTYTYDVYGNRTSETTADGDSQIWQYDAYGHVLNHRDLSGANYNYSYDANSQQQTGESDNWSGASQSTPPYVSGPINVANSSTRTYYANGLVKTITYADGSVYSYQYDANGNVTSEESTTRDGNNTLVHVITQTTYDSHNRVSHVVTTNLVTGAQTLDLNYYYDGVGNRREIVGTSGNVHTEAWYTYDGDNRVLVSAGKLANGVISVSSGSQSYGMSYDGAGNAVTRTTVTAAGHVMTARSWYDSRNQLVRADYAVDVTSGGASRGIEELRTYDENGHSLTVVQFYALGTTLNNRPSGKTDPDDVGTAGTGTNIGGAVSTAVIDRYDAYGRLFEEQNFAHASGWDGSDASAPPPSGMPAPDATTYGTLTLKSAVVYQGPNASAGYDAAGNVVFYQYREASGRTDQYTVTYIKKDGYLESATSGQNVSNTPNVRPTTDESFYDRRGNRVAISQHTQYTGGAIADTVRVFAYDGHGQIIERRDGTANGTGIDQGTSGAAGSKNQHYVYVNGQQVAHYDEAGTLDVLTQVTAFSSGTTSGYVVQAGDTLKSIAQSVYGNASLWYVIAQANAISGDSELSVGQDLTIPEVQTNQNDATTYKPYNSSEIAGSTTPSLPTIAPPPPPPSGHHCNTLATIIIVAVIVVVSIYTAGAAAGALSGVASTGSTFATGAAVLSGTSAYSAGVVIGAAAIGGAAGNAAGQLAGDALGTHQGFSLGEALTAGITSGVTAGVGTAIQGSSSLSVLTDGAGGYSAGGAAVLGATGYAAQSAAANLTGQRSQFSWAGLIASAAASGITAETGLQSGDAQARGLSAGTFGRDLGGSLLSGAVQREGSLVLGDDRVSGWRQTAAAALGTSIGMQAAKALNGPAPAAAKAEDPLDAWRRSLNGENPYDNLGPAGHSLDPTDLLGAYNREGVTTLAASDPWLGTDEQMMAEAAYGSRADWIAQVDTSGLGSVPPAYYRASDLDRLTAGASQLHQTAISGKPEQREIAQHALSIYDAATREGARTTYYEVSQIQVAQDAVSAALDGRALPASSDLITAPTLLTPSAINTVDLASVNVTANVPADDSFFGGIGNQLAQNYRAGRQVVDNVLQGANHLIDRADATIDSARGALRDWSGQRGGVIGGAIGKYVSDQIGAAQGFGLAAAKAVTGTASLAVSVSDVTNPASWVLDTERNIDHVMSTYRTLDTIDSVTSLGRWAADPQQSLHNATALWDGVTAEYRKDLAVGDWSKAFGRLGFEVVSAGGPLLAAKVGRVGAVAEAVDEAAAAARGADISAVAVGRGSVPKTITANIGKNSVTWVLNSEGNTVSATGTLRESFSGAVRSSAEVRAQANAAASGIAGDQGGHLVAHRFVLDQGSVNLFPQEGNFNMSAFKTLENDYQRYTSQGYQVDFAHTLGDFDSLNGRPGSLSVRYEVTDANGHVVDTFADKYLNQSGQVYLRRAH